MNKEIPTTDTNKTSAFTEADLAAARQLAELAAGNPDEIDALREMLASDLGGPEGKVGAEVVKVAGFGKRRNGEATTITEDIAPDHWRTPRG
ncbi:hypothetical protein IPF89_04615 [Candidatus Saccharibacteria bacterium]|nr:MAG: hypothetical protein IPF89_04615 [Candidatus Saccharibacteria bacterium]